MPTLDEGNKQMVAMAVTAPLDEARWSAWVEKGRAQERRNSAIAFRVVKWALLAALLIAVGKTVRAEDLSKYRDFQFGAGVPAVAKLTSTSANEIKVLDSRPALIQEITWRPRPLDAPSGVESVREVVFTFYDGALFRMVVNYDRYETEGLTREDMVGAISAAYGPAGKLPAAVPAAGARPGDQDEILAQWQDSEHRFDLIRSGYRSTFRLVGVLKNLEAPAEAAALEGKRLDDREAPQRDAARAASEEQEAQAKLEKARLLNKLKFRP